MNWRCCRGVQGRRRKRSKPSWDKGQDYEPPTAAGGGSLLKMDVPRKQCAHYRGRRWCSTLSFIGRKCKVPWTTAAGKRVISQHQYFCNWAEEWILPNNWISGKERVPETREVLLCTASRSATQRRLSLFLINTILLSSHSYSISHLISPGH